MLDRNQLKAEGLRFARSLQMVFKLASMFSGTQSASDTPVVTSFNLLNELVKTTRQFTVGFVDNRILINNILTTDRSLRSLETDFLKRGIGAITFEVGMTLTAYKRAVAVFCAPAKEIEAQGGLSLYLQANPIEFIRIFPASKNQHRNEAGDTIVEDSESFLMWKAMSDAGSQTMDRVDWFMQQSGITGTPGGGGGEGSGGFASGYGGGDGGGLGGSGSGSGDGPAGSVPGQADASAAPPAGVNAIGAIVGNYFNSVVSEPDDAPQQRSYVELARIIQETRPEFVLQNFSPQRREELRKLPPEQMAAEVIEDTAVKWAAERLVSSPTGSDAVIVEEEVVRVLLRSLQATQMAGRMARKLAEYAKEFQIPQSTYARIQEELTWITVPQQEKIHRLMVIHHYTRMEFRRLIGLVADLVKAGEMDHVQKLALHYFAILALPQPPEPEEMGRAPELINAVAGLQPEFWSTTALQLCEALNRWPDQKFLHRQLINALAAMCKSLAVYEEFELIDTIGKTLERLATENPGEHSNCCGQALTNLLTPHAMDRIVELFIQRKDDHNWMRVCVNLLRRAGGPGIARVFQYLEEEKSATLRMALLRLIGRVGPAALDLARGRITDQRWYVVRNACKLLSDLKDPELLVHVVPALTHADERVQTAAIAAVLERRNPRRAGVLAAALPHLHQHALEVVLSELMFLRDPVCVAPLGQLIFHDSRATKTCLLCAQILASISGPQSELILLRVLAESSFDPAVRRAAIAPLVRSQLGSTHEALKAFTATPGSDPLHAETLRALSAASKG